MATVQTLSLLLLIVLAGCSDANEEAAAKSMVETQPGRRSGDPLYGDPQKIAAPFRFAFEESSIELCSSPTTQNAPKCLSASRRCWLVFDDNANKDMDRITRQTFIAEEGSYWIEGVGRTAVSDRGFGHLNLYGCQMEMTKVSRFVELPS